MGSFRTVCYFSHASYDDPIVLPGQPGASHLHYFFGNDSTNATSTLATLKAGGSTCRGGAINLSAYWQPAMIDASNSTAIPARVAIVYYKNGGRGVAAADVRSMPQGLRMVAGNPKATDAGAPYGPAEFKCDGNAVVGDDWRAFPNPRGPHSIPSLADCGVGHEIWASVVFPQCWDGVNLDSPDHRSHMAYFPIPNSFGGKCPPDHPVALPEIVVSVLYPVRLGDSPSRWRLASDMYDPALPGGYSLHADWFGVWRPEIVDTFVTKCINPQFDCQAHMLGDGRTMDEFGGN